MYEYILERNKDHLNDIALTYYNKKSHIPNVWISQGLWTPAPLPESAEPGLPCTEPQPEVGNGHFYIQTGEGVLYPAATLFRIAPSLYSRPKNRGIKTAMMMETMIE